MPNWCFNIVTARGKAEDIEDIVIKVTNASSFLEGLFPRPEDIYSGNLQLSEANDKETDGVSVERKHELLAKYGAWNWYNWNLTNWGTKWADKLSPETITVTDAKNGKLKAEFIFDTAWSPPEEGMEIISKKYPNIGFTLYFEEESNLYPSATIVYKNGKVKEK